MRVTNQSYNSKPCFSLAYLRLVRVSLFIRALMPRVPEIPGPEPSLPGGYWPQAQPPISFDQHEAILGNTRLTLA
jgi:hypothetical protein